MPYRRIPDHILRDIFRAASGEKVFLLLDTARPDDRDRRSLFFSRPRAALSLTALSDVDAVCRTMESWLAAGLHLAGWFAYEAGALFEARLAGLLPEQEPKRVLACLYAFPPPVLHDHRDDPAAFLVAICDALGLKMPAGQKPLPDYAIRLRFMDEARADYLVAVNRIREYIREGDCYQVNHTLQYPFSFGGSPEAFYMALRRAQSVPHAAFFRDGDTKILSLSPELFFRIEQGRIITRPMKGTAARGRNLDEDTRLAARLQNDPKNRSENVMIVDLLRNDLGRICSPGSVRVDSLFDVETYETLMQMTSTVSGRLRRVFDPKQPDGRWLGGVFRALFPCGSVTGAPKIRAMEIIASLEKARRGVYCGAMGFVAPDGDACFSVPIRTVVLEKDQGSMGIGSGIVADSDPENEWRECLLKADFLVQDRPDFSLVETMLWLPDHGFWLIDLHLQRLAASASWFLFPWREEKVRQTLATAEERLTVQGKPARLRLLYDRDAGVGITDSFCPMPSLLAAGEPDSLDLAALAAQPALPAFFAQERVSSGDPFLQHKTTRRRLYDDLRQQAVAGGFFEIFFENERAEITEGSISNIFVLRRGVLSTPPVSGGLLGGVLRRWLLERFPGQVQEAVLRRDDLDQARAVFAGNSVRGLVRVELSAAPAA